MNFPFASLLSFSVVLLMSCGQKPVEIVKTINVDSLNLVKEKSDSSRKDIQMGVLLQPVRDRADLNFFKRIDSHVYYCSSKGKIERADTTGANRELLFDLKVNYIIDRVYLLPLTNDEYVICWQETSYEGLNSYVYRFKSGNPNAVWKINYKAPDPGVPVLCDGHLYLSTLGIIGKVNAENGQHSWLHDSLYETTSMRYKKFDVPQIYPVSVVFFDFPIQGRKGKRDSIWVNDKTGQLTR